ncbi:MAG: glycosyltransferase, partial [Bryobacteraceae bacterium]
MMRVAHVITSLHTGGAETWLYNLLSRMDRRRFDPVVIPLRPGGAFGPRIERLGIPVRTGGLRLRGVLRDFRPDLVQAWMYHAHVASIAAAPAGTPVLWNIRAASADLHREKLTTAIAIRLNALLSGRPARILCNSRAAADVHRRQLGFRAGRWEIVPNGFDLDRFSPSGEARRSLRAELGLDPNAVLIGMAGRYHPVKDHAGFLRAAAIVRRSFEVQF